MTRGRPRDPDTTDALMAATLARLATHGYHAMTLDDVVRDAGSTKPAVYRRWPTKAELTAAAVRHALARANPAPPATDDARADVRAILANLIRALTRTPLGGAIRNLVGAADAEPALAATLGEVERERRAVLHDAIARIRDRRAAPDVIVDALLGAIYFRLLLRRTTPTLALADELIALI